MGIDRIARQLAVAPQFVEAYIAYEPEEDQYTRWLMDEKTFLEFKKTFKYAQPRRVIYIENVPGLQPEGIVGYIGVSKGGGVMDFRGGPVGPLWKIKKEIANSPDYRIFAVQKPLPKEKKA